MNRVKCFLARPTTTVNRFLRRYEDGTCAGGKFSYHNAMKFHDDIDVPATSGVETDDRIVNGPPPEDLVLLFPEKCDCGFRFTANSTLQVFTDRQYENVETGDRYSLGKLPPGAMYYADWMLHETTNLFRGPDGHSLIVILPNGNPWTIDGPANNCTNPQDHDHKCWVRHGAPPLITVDKNGNTCAAGAGSIQSGNYHGFLRNGFLEEC